MPAYARMALACAAFAAVMLAGCNPQPAAQAPATQGGASGARRPSTEHLVSEKRSAAGFDSILLHGAGTLVLVQDGTESLTLQASKAVLPLLETRVTNGTLELGPKEGATVRGASVYEVHARDQEHRIVRSNKRTGLRPVG